MQNKLFWWLMGSFLVLLILAVWSTFMGVYVFEKPVLEIVWLSITDFSKIADADFYVLFDLRLPRVVHAILVGSMLAVSGTCLQGMFKNALATPDLIGITSGASLFAALTIVLGAFIRPLIPEYFHFSLLSFMSFVGALLTMILVYRIATKQGKTNVVLLLLTGVAFTAIGFSFTGFLIYLAKDDELRDLTFWNLGSLGGATWSKNGILAIVMLISYVMILNKGKALNAFLLGEKDAAHLGIPVEKIKKQMVVLTALMVGTTVAFTGTIGFVGLIVPYILRLIFKSNYHYILPLSAVMGSILLLAADTLSRTLAAPSEIPIGIITALMGAPIFMVILLKNRKSLAH
jgi:iron complex transport system permease protein